MEKHSGALYLECNRDQAVVSWIGSGLNLACTLWCAAWLVLRADSVHPGWPMMVAATLVGLFFADLFSGLIHWGTDTWFDELMLTRVVSIAREHHIYPHHITGYGFRDYVGYSSWPSFILLGPIIAVLTFLVSPSSVTYLLALVCGEVCGFMLFGTYFHRFGHARARSRIVRLLQKAHLLVTPQYHGLHHRGTHDTHYCVVNGWANTVCDAIGFWRGLEKVIRALTGAMPRRNDAEWFARFYKDRSFMTDPVPSLLELRNENAR